MLARRPILWPKEVISYADDLVFSSSRQEPAIRAEAHTTDVQISSVLIDAVVYKVTNLLASVDIVDLRRAVAASGDKPSVMAEADTAHDALVSEVVNEVHVETTMNTRIENGVPVFALALQVWRELVGFVFGELIPNLVDLTMSVLEVRRNLRVLLLLRWRGSWSSNVR